MWSRSELKTRAKSALKLNYWKAVLVSVILTFITGGSSGGSSANSVSSAQGDSAGTTLSGLTASGLTALAVFLSAMLFAMLIFMVLGTLLSIFVFNPISVGAHRFFLSCDSTPTSLKDLVFAFSSSYGNVIKTMFLRGLYLALWYLLLIVPGIIKSYEYRMIPYILAENPGISTKEAFARSREMMNGQKWNAFVLDLSFIGWGILSILTLGILNIFYVGPYYNLTNAELYKELRGNARSTTDTVF